MLSAFARVSSTTLAGGRIHVSVCLRAPLELYIIPGTYGTQAAQAELAAADGNKHRSSISRGLPSFTNTTYCLYLWYNPWHLLSNNQCLSSSCLLHRAARVLAISRARTYTFFLFGARLPYSHSLSPVSAMAVLCQQQQQLHSIS